MPACRTCTGQSGKTAGGDRRTAELRRVQVAGIRPNGRLGEEAVGEAPVAGVNSGGHRVARVDVGTVVVPPPETVIVAVSVVSEYPAAVSLTRFAIVCWCCESPRPVMKKIE